MGLARVRYPRGTTSTPRTRTICRGSSQPSTTSSSLPRSLFQRGQPGSSPLCLAGIEGKRNPSWDLASTPLAPPVLHARPPDEQKHVPIPSANPLGLGVGSSCGFPYTCGFSYTTLSKHSTTHTSLHARLISEISPTQFSMPGKKKKKKKQL